MTLTQGIPMTANDNDSVEYKPDRVVSDFEVDFKGILRLYLEAVNARDFWSGAEKFVFADRWTCLMQRVISRGTIFHGLKHRLVLDEEDEQEIY
jgi:hypothetical protein